MSETVPWTFQIVDVVFVSHILYILSVDPWISLYRDPFKNVLKYLENNLRRPFENCEFTPLIYKITLFSVITILINPNHMTNINEEQ